MLALVAEFFDKNGSDAGDDEDGGDDAEGERYLVAIYCNHVVVW